LPSTCHQPAIKLSSISHQQGLNRLKQNDEARSSWFKQFSGEHHSYMQGNLSEIDIRSILQLIELGQRTGELFVETYSAQTGTPGLSSFVNPRDQRTPKTLTGKSWFVFFLNGQIVYAADAHSTLSRLRDYLRRYRVDTSLDRMQTTSIAATNAPEYGYLWALIEDHTLTPAQGRDIIQSMVHETLFDLLSIHHGAFIFEISSALAPQLTTLETGSLVMKTMKQVQEWKQFHPHIQSPDQCPVIANAEQLRESLPESIFNQLDRWVDGKTSIRQMSRYLNREVITVAKAIYPYVQQGLVQLAYQSLGAATAKKPSSKSLQGTELPHWTQSRAPRVICIDDGVTIREAVEYILTHHGYESITIENPLEAFRVVFQLKPDLILCDIAMPELDGYEICAMLRHSTAFRQIPIVMLTGKDGFIDRVRAKMVGATDYLTKPFGENELLMLVEKYIGSGVFDRSKPINPEPDRKLVSHALKDELEIGINESASTYKTN